jgi:hypothetical protein
MKNLYSIILVFVCLTTGTPEAATVVGGVAGTLAVKNSIIYNDTTYSQIASTITISNSAVRGSSIPTGTGNLLVNSYTAFKDALASPVDTFSYYLSPTSTLTDAGNTSVPSYMPPKDLNGNDRVYNGTIDIGAVEYSEIYQNTTGTWNTATGWNTGRIPNASDIVTIRSATTVSTADAVCKSIISIDPGASLTINTASQLNVINSITNTNPNLLTVNSAAGQANGTLIFHNTTGNPNATVDMYTQAYKGSGVTVGSTTYYYSWQYFGIPVQSIANASPTFDGSYVRSYNEASTGQYQKWTQLNNSSPLNSFQGYEITQANPTMIVFQGLLENSNKTITLTNTPGAYNPGQNIISNSFTAAIDIRQLSFGPNTEQTIYLFNTGSFAQWYNSSGAPYTDPSLTLPGQYLAIPKNNAGTGNIPYDIPSMSGFLVNAPTSGVNGSLTINYSTGIIQNAHPQRAPSQVKHTSNKIYLEITLKGKRTGDSMWLINQPGTTHGFDNGWDGYKLSGTLGTPELFAMEDSGNYQVSTSSDMSNTFLGFQAGLDLEDTLTFYSENLLTQYAGIYLEDLVKNKVIDVSTSGTQYAFVTDSTPAPVKRFMIITNPTPKEVAPDTSTYLKVFSSGNTVFVQNRTNQNGKLIVYDMMGRNIKETNFGPNNVSAFQIDPISGTYVINAITNNEKVSKKIILGL